ncbi:MAG TPA: BMP family ABC transporter substrate-binding protein, partial [bacterium]|nr:BMP family ABC transporter substrate-binding protein [bacterium]
MTGLRTQLLIALFFFFSCAPRKEADGLRVGLVFDVGGRGDKSFNDSAYRGLERARKELGIHYEYIEPGEGSDRETALR